MPQSEDDLDALVSQRNSVVEPRTSPAEPASTAASAAALIGWLRRVREANGSDLLLVAGVPPTVRAANGKLFHASPTVLDGDDIEAAVLPVVPRRLEGKYREGSAVDLAFKLPQPGGADSGHCRTARRRQR